MSETPITDALRKLLAEPVGDDPAKTNADAIVDVWTAKCRDADPRWFKMLLDTLPKAEAQELARRVADRLAADEPPTS